MMPYTPAIHDHTLYYLNLQFFVSQIFSDIANHMIRLKYSDIAHQIQDIADEKFQYNMDSIHFLEKYMYPIELLPMSTTSFYEKDIYSILEKSLHYLDISKHKLHILSDLVPQDQGEWHRWISHTLTFEQTKSVEIKSHFLEFMNATERLVVIPVQKPLT